MENITLNDIYKQRELHNYENAKELMSHLLNTDPNNAFLNYQMAWCYDNLGNETSAIPFYEKAITLGLDDEILKDAYLGLASTYRSLGKYQESQQVFEMALEKFKDSNSLRVFYAMTLYNLNQSQKAVSLLLEVINKTTGDEEIQKYNRAINYYKDNLDEIIQK